MKNLVIVESPAKAKTIKKFLGKGFEVIASMGHVRDLPKSKIGIDFENNFEPHYISMRDKSKVIKKLKEAAKGKDTIYLATDPDREGEAIAWHLCHLLEVDIDAKNRVTFNEITKSGIKNGMDNPRKIDIDLVDAQQARRMLDRIVGYQLSPFLWKKIRRGLSAGRVQSVAVRLVVEREEEIRAFVPVEYWSIGADLFAANKAVLESKFYGDPEKLDLKNKEQTDEILKNIDEKEFKVDKVKKGIRQRKPSPPFTTSTLQQDASSRLGFQARRTMRAAQDLYEGVNLPELGATGLITYMRTDSLRISDEAYESANEYINKNYGKQYIPEKRRIYATKAKSQDGHEAIRPTMPELHPDDIKDSLSSDQLRLYQLIWTRFMASQMANAVHDTMRIELLVDKYVFNASGYTVKFNGFTVVYEELDEKNKSEERDLPPLKEGEMLKVKEIKPNQHFTQAPPRFTEASLIKILEENGIGRPSTYAPTISTITSRNYVERDGRSLVPTILGETTNKLMVQEFSNIVNEEFTAEMENSLDKVEDGEVPWKQVITDFYKDFEKTLEQAEKNMEGKTMKIPDEETDEICEVCEKPMVIKFGRFGRFLACTGFPDCKNTKSIVEEAKGKCPKDGGDLHVKKTKRNRVFYGCENYPDCDFASWDEPTNKNCPECNNTLFKKGGKTPKLHCMNQECLYEEPIKSKK